MLVKHSICHSSFDSVFLFQNLENCHQCPSHGIVLYNIPHVMYIIIIVWYLVCRKNTCICIYIYLPYYYSYTVLFSDMPYFIFNLHSKMVNSSLKKTLFPINVDLYIYRFFPHYHFFLSSFSIIAGKVSSCCIW